MVMFLYVTNAHGILFIRKDIWQYTLKYFYIYIILKKHKTKNDSGIINILDIFLQFFIF